MESVEPEKDKGEEMVAVRSEPVPLPTRRPLSVVEPVPPLGTVRAVARLTAPPTLRTEEMVVEPVTARAVVVAPVAVSPPLKAMAVVVALLGKR